MKRNVETGSKGSGGHKLARKDSSSLGGASGSMAPGDLDADLKDLKGHLLVEAIFEKYGVGTVTIPWFHKETGERNIRPDPCNRPIMESLAEAYCDRILASGLNVDCSGARLVMNRNTIQ